MSSRLRRVLLSCVKTRQSWVCLFQFQFYWGCLVTLYNSMRISVFIHFILSNVRLFLCFSFLSFWKMYFAYLL